MNMAVQKNPMSGPINSPRTPVTVKQLAVLDSGMIPPPTANFIPTLSENFIPRKEVTGSEYGKVKLTFSVNGPNEVILYATKENV